MALKVFKHIQKLVTYIICSITGCHIVTSYSSCWFDFYNDLIDAYFTNESLRNANEFISFLKTKDVFS